MSTALIQVRALLPSPLDVPAWYDSASNLIGTSYSLEEHDFTDERRPDGAIVVDQADHPLQLLNHELAHFVQHCSTTYLIEWSGKWRAIVRAVLRESSYFDAPISTSLPNALLSLNRPDLLDEARQHLTELHRPSALGISVSHLTEGHALFQEARVHTSVASPRDLGKYMRDYTPHAHYTRAYDLARLWIGDLRAYLLFHGVFVASMSTARPADTYASILKDLARAGHRKDNDFLGWVAKLWTHTMDKYASIAAEHTLRPESYSYVRLFHDWLRTTGADAAVRQPELLATFEQVPTVVYAADDDNRFVIRPGTAEEDPQDGSPEAEANFRLRFTTAGVASWLSREVSEAPEALIDSAAFDWLPQLRETLLHYEVRLDGVDLELDKLHQAQTLTDQLDEFSGWMAEHGMDWRITHQINPTLCRRIWLSFDTDDPREVYQIPVVGAFVQALRNRYEYLPLLLNYDGVNGVVGVWFASLVAAAQLGPGQINVSHPDMIREVLSFLEAVHRFEPLDVDLQPAIYAAMPDVVRPTVTTQEG